MDPPPVAVTKRTTLRIDDERARLIEQASNIIRRDDLDEPPMSDVIDAALTHLIQSRENIDGGRDTYPPQTIKDLAGTDVLTLHYRTAIVSRWRK